METTKEVRKEQTDGAELTTVKTTAGLNPEQKKESRQETGVFQVRYMVYYIAGFIEILLLFRLTLKFLGANPASGFVAFIYSVTGIFIAPFAGIFHIATTKGIETASVFEPAALIAILVCAIIAWGIVRLIDVLVTGKR
jgi:hypothetical protein